MIKNKQTRRTIAVFFLLNFLSTVLPYNALYAQSVGPNAPEAAAFEPVDATDMVNLLTGDFTYVLPLMNVPSPEGGYPLALSYHAGIAMDQESSWVGLGWNINPGAINRSVNGIPDDFRYATSTEYFYSSTEEINEYQASVGYSWGAGSVGLGVSWGSNRSLGGFVSAGYGFDLGGVANLGVNARIGTDSGSSSIGVGIKTGELTFGASIDSKGNVEGNFGIDVNGTGFSVSTSGTYSLSVGGRSGTDTSGSITSTEITFSSGGVGISVTNNQFKGTADKDGNISYNRTGGTGVGLNFLKFKNTVNMGDYSTNVSSNTIPLFVPTPIGIFSFSFGKSTFKYNLNKLIENNMFGPVHFGSMRDYLVYERVGDYAHMPLGFLPYDYTQEELNELVKDVDDYSIVNPWPNGQAMDLFELSLKDQSSIDDKDLLEANATYPSYDKFVIQSQGLSGAMSVKLLGNGGLYGFSERETSDGKKLSYILNKDRDVKIVNGEVVFSDEIPYDFLFKNKAQFYFENEISTYIETPKSILKAPSSSDLLTAYNGEEYSDGILDKNKADNIERRKTANFIQYFTNGEIASFKEKVKREGYLKPIVTGFREDVGYEVNSMGDASSWNGNVLPVQGIGAFKITAIDGRTYHYSLPVYNHETVERIFGTMKYKDGRKGIKPESEAYFEKKQLEPYATHWLLTAVTGPDFVDVNDNGVADKGDYGYWVSFEYGKYSDAYTWAAPYGKEVQINEKDPNIKSWIKGRKEVYYLDRVKTRTHTAVFVKSKRKDAKSEQFTYKSARATGLIISNGQPVISDLSYVEMFTIPEQFSLKLDKIVLIEGEDSIGKSSGGITEQEIEIDYPGREHYSSVDVERFTRSGKSADTKINMMNNVIDVNDNLSSLNNQNIVKVVEFDNNYYDLAKGTPNSNGGGRLTLKGVSFKGKKETTVLPPYKFNYINPVYSFNIDDRDDFGYNKGNNSIWSLNEITTPQGGKIKVEYDGHKVKSVMDAITYFSAINDKFKINILDSNKIELSPYTDLGFIIGEKIEARRNILIRECNKDGCRTSDSYIQKIEGEIIEVIGKKATVLLKNVDLYATPPSGVVISKNLMVDYLVKNPLVVGGIRVKRVSTVNEEGKYYNMNYSYGENGDGVGYVTYLPSAPELAKELPYSSELPPPIPMYEYVSTTTSTGNSSSENNIYGVKTEYRFNVLKSKEPGKAKFGDFYELTSEQIYGTSSSDTQLYDFVVKDNLGAIGQLLSVKSYNQQGQILNKIENTYYSPGETPEKLGITQESYQTYKKITDSNSNEKKLGATSTRITYPNLLKNSTELRGGDSYTSEYNDLDPITGQAREIYSYSSTGLKFLSKGVQAYTKYPQMGSKADDVNNKNMLSQVAANYEYLFKDGDWKPIGVGITTWNNSWEYEFNNKFRGSTNEVWRKHKTYTWKGAKNEDGTLGFTDSTNDFNWGIGAVQTNNWQETSHITRYNQFSQPLEVKDINDNYAATKMGDNYSKVIATANAKYDEMYYSGAEYVDGSHFDGGILATGYKKVSKEEAHTGTGIVEVSEGVSAFNVNIKDSEARESKLKQRFKISVWVKQKDGITPNLKIDINYGDADVNWQEEFISEEDVQAGEWVLKQGYVNIPEEIATVSIKSTNGTVQLDDFRFHPVSSSMISYVYNEWDEVSYITGANGLSTHYIYDAAGRLVETQVETVTNTSADIEGGFRKVFENRYNYKRNNQ